MGPRRLLLTGLLAIAGVLALESDAQAFGKRRGNGCYGGCWGGGYTAGCWGGVGGCWGSAPTGCHGGVAHGGCWGSAAPVGCWGSAPVPVPTAMYSGYGYAPRLARRTVIAIPSGVVIPANSSTTAQGAVVTAAGTVIPPAKDDRPPGETASGTAASESTSPPRRTYALPPNGPVTVIFVGSAATEPAGPFIGWYLEPPRLRGLLRR
jgi:hypothetical protein